MTYKIVFFDIDGTLLDSHKKVPRSAMDAIQQLRQNGVICAIASARTPFNTHVLLDQLHMDTYIVYNGGLIIHQNEILHQAVINPDQVQSLLATVRKSHHVAIPEGRYHFAMVGENLETITEEYIHGWDRSQLVSYEVLKEPISQIDLFCKDEEISPYENTYPDLTFYPWLSHPNAFNVIPKGVSKAYGIQLVLEKLGIAKADSVAFGDGPNDQEMLSYVGMGVAMGNATDSLKADAGYITKHVDDDGIAYGLKHLGLLS